MGRGKYSFVRFTPGGGRPKTKRESGRPDLGLLSFHPCGISVWLATLASRRTQKLSDLAMIGSRRIRIRLLTNVAAPGDGRTPMAKGFDNGRNWARLLSGHAGVRTIS